MRGYILFLLIVLMGLVVATWYSVVIRAVDWIKVEDLTPLFTGLGFVAIFIAFLHERRAAAEGAKAHHELVQAMLAQAAKSGALVVATGKNTRVMGIAAELSVRELQIVHKDPHEGAVEVAARRAALIEELARLL